MSPSRTIAKLAASLVLSALAVGAQQSTNIPPTAATNAASQIPATTNQLARAEAEITSPPADKAELNGEKGLRLNFRGVSLDMVLSYLSEAAGFIVVLEEKVEGKIDLYCHQPVAKDEAVKLLDTILNKNGYAAIRNDRTLTIVARDEAKKRNLRVQVGSDPAAIPKNDEMVTQILPVRYANAVQMVKDLQSLLPLYAHLTANESANSLVLTDTQADIRRMAEIIKALDTSISAIATVRVFPLSYADAKDLASEIKELFAPSSSSGGQGGRGGPNVMTGFRGGRRGGGGGNAAPGGSGQSEAREAATRVTAVADERTNSLIVSAPEEILNLIDELVTKIDLEAESITMLVAFHLKNADPQQTADLLNNLFPDDTRSNNGNNRSTFQFGRGGRGGFGGGGRGNTATTSNRARQQNRVVAVADPRTSTLLVGASKELMEQIRNVIDELDNDAAFRQTVFVYSLKNAQVDDAQQILSDLFQSVNSRNASLNSQNNPLEQRRMNQGYGNNGSTFGGARSGSGIGARR